MTLYRFGDLVLESDFPFELATAEGEVPELVFQLTPDDKCESGSWNWFYHCRLSNGDSWLSLAKQDFRYLLRFPDLADFLISIERGEIYCYSRADTPLETIQHLLLDQVMPCLLNQLGRVVLHAGAVLTPEGAIAFLGESSWGKSTLTASFCQQGFPVLSDDSLCLRKKEEKIFVCPSYPGIRLWPETVSVLFEKELHLSQVTHYNEKRRLNLRAHDLPFCSDPVPLRQIYVLASPEEQATAKIVSVSPLSPRDAFMALVNYVYRLDFKDRDSLKEEFGVFSQIVTLVEFYQLLFPRNFSFLPAIQATVLRNL